MLLESSESEIPGSDPPDRDTGVGESVGKRIGVPSDFGRQRIVETGQVRNVYSSVSLSASGGRVWVGSSVKSYSQKGGRVYVFERGSRLEQIPDADFQHGLLKSITIPASVVVLGKESFELCKSLEWVLFEPGSRLERIEKCAFDMTGLTAIVIPSSVVVLGPESFHLCIHLVSVSFESGSRLERIERAAFHISMLESIEIPSRVAFIDPMALKAPTLSSLSVSPDNRSFRLRDGFLEDLESSVIYGYFGHHHVPVVPSSVVVLGKESFAWNHELAFVTFGTGSRLERIEECAFGHTGLRSIVIPSSVVVLEKGCFKNCSRLESVAFENGSRLELFEESLFDGSGLRSIVIPSSVVVLGKQSFYHCKSLESVVFESDSRLKRIEEMAFANSGLKSIEIPPSIRFIHDSAWRGTPICWSTPPSCLVA
jgi:hypothetical protein